MPRPEKPPKKPTTRSWAVDTSFTPEVGLDWILEIK